RSRTGRRRSARSPPSAARPVTTTSRSSPATPAGPPGPRAPPWARSPPPPPEEHYRPPAVNILLITLDQFRGDSLSCAGHPLVQTPNLDALAAEGVRLARHSSQATPCAPGRACLYTGTYQMNNRVVANGTPLDAR